MLIFPFSPGFMGSFGQSGTVQPHDGFTLCITSGVLPGFENLKKQISVLNQKIKENISKHYFLSLKNRFVIISKYFSVKEWFSFLGTNKSLAYPKPSEIK